jgi:hypothetical protein
MQKNLCEYQGAYTSLRQSLAKVGWISEGYVQDRGPGAGGPHYQWTRKVRAKTVSVALSKEQYEWLHQAIANWRQVQQIIKEMQRLSRRVLFETVPHPPRRKRLGKKVLGLIYNKCHSPVRGGISKALVVSDEQRMRCRS